MKRNIVDQNIDITAIAGELDGVFP